MPRDLCESGDSDLIRASGEELRSEKLFAACRIACYNSFANRRHTLGAFVRWHKSVLPGSWHSSHIHLILCIKEYFVRSSSYCVAVGMQGHDSLCEVSHTPDIAHDMGHCGRNQWHCHQGQKFVLGVCKPLSTKRSRNPELWQSVLYVLLEFLVVLLKHVFVVTRVTSRVFWRRDYHIQCCGARIQSLS